MARSLDIFAVSDVDVRLYNGLWPLEANTPSHESIRNALYFDSHVKSYKGTNFSGHLLNHF